jgi:hypothetical protein
MAYAKNVLDKKFTEFEKEIAGLAGSRGKPDCRRWAVAQPHHPMVLLNQGSISTFSGPP